ncbi:MAG: dihydrofolate reductase [Christensenellaceae bacterium]|jgi:dihydrofolate reductase
MNMIAAVDRNWGIGKNGDLLFRIPEDMKFFRETTLDKVVVMGRRTLESLPGGRPLPKRTNIVLTENTSFSADGAQVCCSLDELFRKLEQYDSTDIFVIGGAMIYDLLMDYCHKAYITKVDEEEDAEVYIRNLDEAKGWEHTHRSAPQKHENLSFTFNVYQNRNVKPYRNDL